MISTGIVYYFKILMPLHIFLTITVAFNMKVLMQSLYF